MRTYDEFADRCLIESEGCPHKGEQGLIKLIETLFKENPELCKAIKKTVGTDAEENGNCYHPEIKEARRCWHIVSCPSSFRGV